MSTSSDSMVVSRAAVIMDRADELGALSEETGMITRRYGTPAMSQAQALIERWMWAAGMITSRDAFGNVLGCYAAENHAETTPFMLGGHFDSVRNAGRYDGPLGILTAIAAVQRLHDTQTRLPFPIEVIAIADEEGMRFHSAFIGSKVITGRLDGSMLAQTDRDGVTLADAIRQFGGDPDRLTDEARPAGALRGFFEVHIEQGPQLEEDGLPVGIVSGFSGRDGAYVTFTGMAGHAGTTPMHLRRDALAGAAELVLAFERVASATPGLVATAGEFDVQPGTSNVIPGEATLTLDLRHPHAEVRRQAMTELQATANEVAERRGLEVAWDETQGYPETPCDAQLTQALTQAVERAGIEPTELPSGAGHDAIEVANIAPVAMLFVRCRGGVSHNPAESITVEDAAVALEVVDHFLDELAATPA